MINPLGLLARAAGAVLNLWPAPAINRAHFAVEAFADREAEEEVAEPPQAWPTCSKCGTKLLEIAAQSQLIPGQFCSRYCVTHAEVDHFANTCSYTIGSPNAPTTPMPPAGVEQPPTPPAGFSLPMFRAAELEAINARYLVQHFPWPDDGLIGCTCGTTGFTISEWSAHVAELQVSETVFFLQSKVYDANNPQEQR